MLTSSLEVVDNEDGPTMEMGSNDTAPKPVRVHPASPWSRPLWEYQAGDDELRLRSRDLPLEDLSRVLVILLGGDPGNLPEALGPLYHRDDRTELVAAMPVFNERGLLPAEGSRPVEVSSGDTSGEGGSEKTVDDLAGYRLAEGEEKEDSHQAEGGSRRSVCSIRHVAVCG
ncbi:hypothetical protein D1007_03115 [Hordeum vulgare]|nr:hypothetical protein D1007_03115 [Hordeum vulgare]